MPLFPSQNRRASTASCAASKRPKPGAPYRPRASSGMVAVQFAVLLLRLLRLPLGTQPPAPQIFSPVDAADRTVVDPRLTFLPDRFSGELRQLRQAPKPRPALATRLAAEAAGTAIIVGGGCGAACALRDATSVSSYTMPVLWWVSRF